MEKVFEVRDSAVISAVATAILLFVCASPDARADKFNTETTYDARNLGMGNAGVNTSRGAYSVFYNPANIAAKDTGTNLQAVNMLLDVDNGWYQNLTGGRSIRFQSLSDLYPDLQKNNNTFVGGRYSIYPNLTIRNLSFGMLYEVNQGAEVRAEDKSLHVIARNRFAPTGALSFRLFSGILRIGGMIQWLTVGNADSSTPTPAQASALDYKTFIDSKSGVSKTAGITLTLPFRYLPSFSVVARDIGTTRFTGGPAIKFGDGGTIPTAPMTFDAATSLTVYLGKRIEMKTELDYKDTTNKMHGGRFRHVFAGTEITFWDSFRIRGGLMHGYFTGGFGFHTPKASLDMAVYAEEIQDRLRGARDQRYVLQYSWSLFK